MERPHVVSGAGAGTVVDARMSLALWLRTGRAQRGMTIDDVARITKIQPRILEKLETGRLDGLPADVFVRGFVRSVARCLGLSESEALTRYTAAAAATGPGPAMVAAPASSATAVTARAFVQSMAELAPVTARAAAPSGNATATATTATATEAATPPQVGASAPPNRVSSTIAVPEALATEEPASRKKPRGKKNKARRRTHARGTGAPGPAPIVASHGTDPGDQGVAAGSSTVDVMADSAVVATPELAWAAPEPAIEVIEIEADEPVATETPWIPTMPPIVASTVPWRRPAHALATSRASRSRIVPSLVIDDAEPEIAERALEERATTREPRRSFLPPILLDPDRSGRQGGLTLAVIILLIAATLTLSYLMRRPSSSGDGVTLDETHAPARRMSLALAGATPVARFARRPHSGHASLRSAPARSSALA